MSNDDQSTVIDLTGVSTELEAMPRGYYGFAIEEPPKKQFTDNDPNRPYYAWVMVVTDPEEYAGRKLFHNTSLQTQSLWSFRQMLEALGYAPEDLDQEFKFDPEETIGCEGVAFVAPEEWPAGSGRMRSRVRRTLAPGAITVAQGTLL
jgi:hypothetical protein